jgi:hypothetical protein
MGKVFGDRVRVQERVCSEMKAYFGMLTGLSSSTRFADKSEENHESLQGSDSKGCDQRVKAADRKK